eukprot:scaffold203386_cov51-Attheya_sp.AAC.4
MTMPPAVSARGRPAASSNHVDGEDGGRVEEEDAADGRGGVKFGTAIAFDDAYGGDESGFVSSLPTLDEERRLLDEDDIRSRERMELEDEGRLTASHPSSRMQAENGSKQGGEDGGADPFQGATGGTGLVNTRIADRESEYHKRRLARPVREDGMSFKDAMQHATLDRERHELVQEARKEFLDDDGNLKPEAVEDSSDAKPARRRRRRWDDSSAGTDPATTPALEPKKEDPSIVVTD